MIEARMLNGLRWLLALAMCLSVFASPALAQNRAENTMRAALFADGAPVAGEQWLLALHFSPVSPEWHGYWRNPGDAGYGMELDWSLPEGWQAGEPLYPVPETLMISGLMNHVYEGNYAVLVPIDVPAGARLDDLGPVVVDAEYLACTDEICVPQQARLAIDPRSAMRDPRFERWQAAIAPQLDSEGRFAIANGRLRVAIPLPASLELARPHVFIGEVDLVDYAAPQRFARSGDLLIAEIELGRAQVPPQLSGIVAFGDGQGVRFSAGPGTVPREGTPLETAPERLPVLWTALLGALAGGLLLNIMPCVFPILSLKALALARAGGDEAQARRDALAYTAGVVLACIALGGVLLLLRAAGEQVGWAFQLQEPSVVVGLLVLAALITANFAGAFELPGLVMRGGEGGASSFATGLLAAFVATPCTGPFMAAAMGAALLLPVAEALALFAMLGLGLALPFLLLGFVPALRRALPRPGPWMQTFRRWMALPMGLTALALAWLVWRIGGIGFAVAALALAFAAILVLSGLFGSSGRSRSRGALLAGIAIAAGAGVLLPTQYSSQAQRPAESIHDPIAFDRAALEQARATGRPVFIWFTADWCVTCKVNEQAAIEREEVRAAFEDAGVIAMRGDWTRRDEEIAGFLTDQGAAGVPLYLWYPPRGEARQLPQVLTADLLVEQARSAPRPGSGTQE